MNIPNKSGFDLHNLDPRVFVVILPLIGAIVLTWTGDRATFLRPPRNIFENLCAILPATGYKLFADRNIADIFSVVIILIVLATLLIPLFGVIHKAYSVQQLTKMYKNQKQESEILQKLHENEL